MAMSIKEQIHDPKTKLDLVKIHDSSHEEDLCGYMEDCPDDVCDMKGQACDICIGQAPMETLNKIQPNLNMDNLESALESWVVLFR